MLRRVTLLAAGVALLAVVAFAVPLGVLASHSYVDNERLQLQQAATTAAATIRGDTVATAPTPPVPPGERLSVFDAKGRLVRGPAPTDRRTVSDALRGRVTTSTGAGRLAAAAPISDGDQIAGAVLVTSSLDDVHDRSRRATIALVGLGLVAVALAAGLARVLAGQLSRPVEALTDTAQRMGGGDLAARAAPTGIPELDTLAVALNTSAGEIEAMIGRERRLSAEVSHQLRTPLAGLRLQLEALAPAFPPAHRKGLDEALASVDRLQVTIGDVIGLARDQPAKGAVDVDELFAGAQEKWQTLFDRHDRALRFEPELDPATLPLSPAAARQILDVLVDNALVHGRGAVTVRAWAAESTVGLDVTDEGPEPEVEPHQMFGPDGPGRPGLGLPLARRLAEAEGGRLALAEVDPPTFRLTMIGT